MSKHSSPVLSNANEVLAAVLHHGAMSASGIAESTGIPRPKVYRLIEALKTTGMLSDRLDGTVELGTRMLRLGRAAQSSIELVRAARTSLSELREWSGHTSYLCTMQDGNALCLDWSQSGTIGLPELRPGGTLPLHAGAASLALLAANPHKLEGTLAQEPFVPLTGVTMTTAVELSEEVRRTREREFSISDGDVTAGVAAVGVAITDNSLGVLGALSLSGVRSLVMPRVAQIAEKLKEAADSTIERLNRS